MEVRIDSETGMVMSTEEAENIQDERARHGDRGPLFQKVDIPPTTKG